MSKTAAWLGLICALVGLGASVAAGYVHYRILFDPTYTSFCDVNATISCTQVYMSRFSTVQGVPVPPGVTGSAFAKYELAGVPAETLHVAAAVPMSVVPDAPSFANDTV